MFLTPSSSASNWGKKKEVKAESSKEQQSSRSNEPPRAAGKPKAKGSTVAGGGGDKKVSAHEALYVRNREMRKVDKRRSYLPYRQDLVGFCASLNGIGRAFCSLHSSPSKF